MTKFVCINIIPLNNCNYIILCLTYYPPSHSVGILEYVLHPEEWTYWRQLKNERRRRSYLLGRYSSKLALSSIQSSVNYQDIFIKKGLLGQPILVHPSLPDQQVSITHDKNESAAITHPASLPCGIDLQHILTLGKCNGVLAQLSTHELMMLQNVKVPLDIYLTLLWTVKEAMSKTIRTGFSVPIHLFEVNNIRFYTKWITCGYTSFPDYQSYSWNIENYIISITLPKSVPIKPLEIYSRLLEKNKVML